MNRTAKMMFDVGYAILDSVDGNKNLDLSSDSSSTPCI